MSYPGVDGAPCGSTVFLSLIEIPFGFKVEIVSLACAYRISGAMYILECRWMLLLVLLAFLMPF